MPVDSDKRQSTEPGQVKKRIAARRRIGPKDLGGVDSYLSHRIVAAMVTTAR